jgi:hypothetical protein
MLLAIFTVFEMRQIANNIILNIKNTTIVHTQHLNLLGASPQLIEV